MVASCAVFYKIPRQEIKKYKYSEIKQMFGDIMYFNKE